jgi:hypothetical protein
MKRTKYQIWDKGILVPAFVRKPKDPRAIRLNARNAEEQRLGIRYYIPAAKIIEGAK